MTFSQIPEKVLIDKDRLVAVSAMAEKYVLAEEENRSLAVENHRLTDTVKKLNNDLTLSESKTVSMRKQRNWLVVILGIFILAVYLSKVLRK